MSEEEFLSWSIGIELGVVTLLLLAAPPILAAHKGYCWYFWSLAWLIGLVALAFLPYVNDPDADPEKQRSKREMGNLVGLILTAVDAIGLVLYTYLAFIIFGLD